MTKSPSCVILAQSPPRLEPKTTGTYNVKIKDLYDTPDKWTKGALARDKNGAHIMEYGIDDEVQQVNHPNAVCWCLTGAILKCYPDNYGEIRAKVRNYTNGGIWTWNDLEGTTFQDIRELVEKLDI